MQYNTIQYNEVVKFWMIQLYLNINDVMHVNEHTKHTNGGLHENL